MTEITIKKTTSKVAQAGMNSIAILIKLNPNISNKMNKLKKKKLMRKKKKKRKGGSSS